MPPSQELPAFAASGLQHKVHYLTGKSFLAKSLPRVNRKAFPMTPMIKPSISKGVSRTKFQPRTPMIPPAIHSNLRETTTRVLASLTPREERVLRMRFGIGMNTDHTLEEVGQQFSVTRERIRQIEAKALRKLKHPSRSRKLRSFLGQ